MTEERLDDVILKINHAGGKVVEKTGWFWTVLHYVVMVITFGSNRDFKRGYYTTLGGIVGYPEGWEKRSIASRVAVLEHELIHIRQCNKMGLGTLFRDPREGTRARNMFHVWLGFPLYGLCYLLLPLPIGLAWFRWRFEREAYAHGINVRTEFEPHRRDDLIDSAVKQLTTGAYGWTWPFPKSVRRYFEEHCKLRAKYMADGLITRDVQ